MEKGLAYVRFWFGFMGGNCRLMGYGIVIDVSGSSYEGIYLHLMNCQTSLLSLSRTLFCISTFFGSAFGFCFLV